MEPQNDSSSLIQLHTDDHQIIVVDCKIAALMKNLRDAVETAALSQGEDVVMVKNVEGPILEIIIKWLMLKAEAEAENEKENENENESDTETESSSSDQFDGKETLLSVLPDNFEQSVFFHVMNAALILGVSSLLIVCCHYTADLIYATTTVDELRELLGIECDLTEDEAARIREQAMWYNGLKIPN